MQALQSWGSRDAQCLSWRTRAAARRWAAVPQADWPSAEAQRAIIMSDFATDTAYGDRRQARAHP